MADHKFHVLSSVDESMEKHLEVLARAKRENNYGSLDISYFEAGNPESEQRSSVVVSLNGEVIPEDKLPMAVYEYLEDIKNVLEGQPVSADRERRTQGIIPDLRATKKTFLM